MPIGFILKLVRLTGFCLIFIWILQFLGYLEGLQSGNFKESMKLLFENILKIP